MARDQTPAPARQPAWGAVAAAVALGVVAWWSRGTSIGSASAQDRPAASGEAPSSATVVALARLLPASGLISVGVRPGVRVVELKVKEDDQVSAGALLATLEGHDSARSQLELAEAQRRRADFERGARFAAARKAADVTRQRLDQGRTLYNQFGATLKGKERYDAEMALYQLEMQGIKTQLDLDLARGTAAADGGDEPAGSKPTAGAGPEEQILKSQVELAAAGLRQAEVRAPGPGRVLRIQTNPGETSAGALLVMGDVSAMVAKAEVYQADVPRIRPGDPAEVDILGTRIAGQVARIGPIVGRNQLTSIDPRALRDLRVVEVTIRLDRAAPADRFIDMEVEAVIRPSGSAGETPGGAGGASSRGPG